MDTTKLIPAVNAALDADLNVMLWGPPGIGKSDLVRQLGAARGLPVIDGLRASTVDPVDLRGMPVINRDTKTVDWFPMGMLPTVERDGPEGILFLDEINTGSQLVQAGFMQLSLDRAIGDYRLPDGWKIVAAGNRTSDKAAANRMSSALANRFAHFDVEISVDAWCKWAIANGLPAAYVAFIRFRPELLHSFESDRTINATPRSHAMAAKLIDKGLAPDVELATVAACIGDGPAAELSGFLRVWRSLPSPDAILMDPDSQPVPDKADVMFAICGALARKVTEQSMSAFVRYIGKLPPEFGVMAMNDAVTRNGALASTDGAIAFYSANSDVYA